MTTNKSPGGRLETLLALPTERISMRVSTPAGMRKGNFECVHAGRFPGMFLHGFSITRPAPWQ